MGVNIISINWFSRLQRKHLLIFLLLYAVIAFWGQLLKGVPDKVDIVKYLTIGLNFWDFGLSALRNGYANNGFSILAGFVAHFSDIHEPYIITLLIGFPCFIGTTYFLFRIFEYYLGENWAILACLFLLTTSTYTRSMVRPLSEVPFFFLMSGTLFLTIVRKIHPLWIGFLLGITFWIRNQTLIFLPFWPIFFDTTKDFKSYIKNGMLLGCSFFIVAVSYFWAQGSLHFHYAREGYPVSSWYWAIKRQLMRLNRDNYLVVYFVGLLSIFSSSIRIYAFRLYVFAVLPFVIQLGLVIQRGGNTRRGTYMIFFALCVCLMFIILKNDIWPFLRKNLKNIAVYGCSVCVAMFFVVNASLPRIGNSLLTRNYIKQVLSPYRLDRRYLFENVEPDAIILTETVRGKLWTTLSARSHNVQLISGAKKNLNSKKPFSASINIINERETPLKGNYLAVWRTCPKNCESFVFPSKFSDKFGYQFNLLAEDKALHATMGLYTISIQ